MNPKKIWSNLGVVDLDRTTKFYTDLGFKSNGRSAELTSFFFGEHDFVMHFFLKDVLASGNGAMTDPRISYEVLYTLSASSREQTDEWAAEVERAGGTLITQPAAFGEGYYGFNFADPDGHRFNVFHMKGL